MLLTNIFFYFIGPSKRFSNGFFGCKVDGFIKKKTFKHSKEIIYLQVIKYTQYRDSTCRTFIHVVQFHF